MARRLLFLRATSRMQDLIVSASRGFGPLAGGGWLVDELMCSGTILLYGIPRVVVGENRTFLGEEELLRSRGVIVEVLQDARCQALMAQFIQEQPTLWAEDIGNGDDRIDR